MSRLRRDEILSLTLEYFTMDPSDFLNQTVTGAFSTQRIPIPKGEYPAMIKDLGHRTMDSKDNPGTIVHMLDVTYGIDDANVKEVTGLPEPSVRQTVFLDLDANGQLDTSKGKNVQLGRLREAAGQNDPNTPWSFGMLKGAALVVSIEHNPGKQAGDVFSNVAKVGKIG